MIIFRNFSTFVIWVSFCDCLSSLYSFFFWVVCLFSYYYEFFIYSGYESYGWITKTFFSGACLFCSFFSFFSCIFYYHILIVQKGLIVIFSFMHIMYLDKIHPSITLHYPPLWTILMCFIILLSYMDIKYFDPIHSHSPFPFILPAPPPVFNFKQSLFWTHVIFFKV
jgi:hypothetical protein